LRLAWLALFAAVRTGAQGDALLQRAIDNAQIDAALVRLAVIEGTAEADARAPILVLLVALFTDSATAITPSLRHQLGLPADFALSPELGDDALGLTALLAGIATTTALALSAALATLPAWLAPLTVGLTTQQVQTLAGLQAQWDTDGLSRNAQRTKAKALILEALQRRAGVIAGDQALSVANLAQRQLLEQAVRTSLLVLADWELEWRIAVNPCTRICKPKNHTRLPLLSVDVPPTPHPNCKCSVAVRRKRQEVAA
jgi:hypothetical protein